QKAAQEAYHNLWSFKWSPPGRGLWAMGTERVHGERGSSTALNNCSVWSTRYMTKDDPSYPFVKLANNSFLGVGVGFDTEGAKKGFVVQEPVREGVYEVPDTREGWADSVGVVINAYLKTGA